MLNFPLSTQEQEQGQDQEHEHVRGLGRACQITRIGEEIS